MRRLRICSVAADRTSLFALLLLLAAHVSMAQAPIRSDFDHESTGFPLDGAHAIAGCGDCHQRGLFVGTPSRCQSCHSQGGFAQATAKPSLHILASDVCDACHATRSFVPVERMDHGEVVGACVNCHDNRIADGKPVDHPATGNDCGDCHMTVAFSPVLRFDHSGIDSGCVNCHNGQSATGKPPAHLPTTELCEDCHRVDTFSVVTAFDHLQAIGSCSGCHDGVSVQGKPADHVPTTAECDACHTTVSW